MRYTTRKAANRENPKVVSRTPSIVPQVMPTIASRRVTPAPSRSWRMASVTRKPLHENGSAPPNPLMCKPREHFHGGDKQQIKDRDNGKCLIRRAGLLC